MSKKWRLGAAGVALIAGAMLTGPASADAIADFYKGKTVKIIFGFSVGGTYGKYSLTLAEFLKKHIPGNPNVIAESRPGAGGVKAANYAFNAMPKDGTGLYMPLETLVITELLRPKAVKYKSDKFTWLGTVVQSNSVIVVRSDTGVKNLADLRTKQVIMAASGKGSPTFLMPATVNGLLGAKFKIVTGYRGSAKMMLSMEQGETRGIALTWLAWDSGRPEWFKPGGYATPLIQIGNQREKALPNVPMLSDLVTSAEDKKIAGFMASLSPIGRGLAVPPGVSKDKISALRWAFDKTVSDPAFIAAAKKRRLPVNALSGERIQSIVNQAMTASPEVVAAARLKIFGTK